MEILRGFLDAILLILGMVNKDPVIPDTTPESTTASIITKTASTELIVTQPSPTKSIRCGFRNDYKKSNLWDPEISNRFAGARIIDGEETKHGEYPWQVALKKKDDEGSTFCGGTLINSWSVLTAAHCMYVDGNKGNLRQRIALGFGWHDSKGKNKSISYKNGKFGQQVINIDLRPGHEKGQVIVHPGYIGKKIDEKTRAYNPHDIAIIVLPTEVKFPPNPDSGIFEKDDLDLKFQRGTFVRPVCMPDTDGKSQRKSFIGNITITGFGTTNKNGTSPGKTIKNNRVQAKKLLKASINSISNKRCEHKFRSINKYLYRKDKFQIGNGQFCADGKSDTCQGDSGGPAVKMIKNKFTIMHKDMEQAELVGITSWGVGCAQGAPGVYTKVSEYMDWIKQNAGVMYTTDGREI